MDSLDKKKYIAQEFFKKGMILTPEILKSLENTPSDYLVDTIAEYEKTSNSKVIDGTDNHGRILQSIRRQNPDPCIKQNMIPFETKLSKRAKLDGNIKVKMNYHDDLEKKSFSHFVSLFRARYKQLRDLLLMRQELKSAVSISRVLEKKDREYVSVIGIVESIDLTRNGNIIANIEDTTGQIRIIISKNKEELFQIGKDLLLDETVGIVGTSGDKVIFVNNIIFPEVPLTKEFKKCPDDVNAAFISDVHVGSKQFLGENFNKFITWINGNAGGAEHKEMASKLKYLFIGGDLVDGIGIYPNQDKDLTHTDIGDQYEEFAELMKKIPSDINIVIIPGNHDATRIAEPQLPPFAEYCKSLNEIDNVTLLSNPSLVNIQGTDGFSGFDVLLYHGYSFDYYAANVESIRNAGGYDRPDLIMKMLLQRRHLAPTNTSTLYIPDKDKDPLVIDTIPDIFQTGHIHRAKVANYRNITLVNSSCWQSRTDFQVKTGHNPDPAKVPLINLKTRKVKTLKF